MTALRATLQALHDGRGGVAGAPRHDEDALFI
jgi:hypothetical protein